MIAKSKKHDKKGLRLELQEVLFCTKAGDFCKGRRFQLIAVLEGDGKSILYKVCSNISQNDYRVCLYPSFYRE